jgi:hypothetical protein
MGAVFSLLALLLAAAPTPPEAAVLSTRPGDAFTELRFQPVGTRELTAPVARFEHLDDATALGALIPGTHQVVATATVFPGDPSFASALVLLEPGRPMRVLADQVAVSNRPLVTAEGRVFVQRGIAGADVTPELPGGKPANALTRVDTLRIDEVRLSGEPRTVLSFRGYTAFLAGSFGPELLVYRVGPAGADLVAVNPDTLAVRTLTQLEPLARDFVVDEAGHRLLFTLGDSAERAWHVESLDLVSLERSRLGGSRLPALLPFVLGGKPARCAGPGAGTVFTDGSRALAPQGPGFDHLRFVTRDGVRVGLDEVPSDFPRAFAVDARGRNLPLAAPEGARLDLAGVTP